MTSTIRSIWRETAHLPSFEPLRSDMKTDVLIIGSGLAGILCAYMLKNAGVDYLLVEAKNICGGVTQDTTAKITVQHGLIYSKLTGSFGSEKAQMYLHANQLALNTYRNLCAKTDCDFEEKDNYVYSLRDRAGLDSELSALQKLGVPAQMKEHPPGGSWIS